MQLINCTVPKEHEIYLLSDIHVGVVQFHKAAFKKVIDEIKDNPKAKVVFLGDLAEGRPSNHKFFSYKTADPDLVLPVQQYQWFEETITPIKDKVITLMDGNHDFPLAETYGEQIQPMCDRLGITFGTFSCVITFKHDKKQLYKIFCHHGSGTIRSGARETYRRPFNMLMSMYNKLEPLMSDCLGKFMAHCHLLQFLPPGLMQMGVGELHLLNDGTKIEQNYIKKHARSRIIHPYDVWYGCTGSFQKQFVLGVSTYGERKMYRPLEMGYLKIISTPEGDDIKSIRKVIV